MIEIKSTLSKRIFKNFSIGFIGSIINAVLGILKTAVLTKNIDLVEYGIVMIVINFYSVFSMIFDLRISDLLFRFYGSNNSEEKELFESVINLSLIICTGVILITALIVLLGSSWIAEGIYDRPDIDHLLRMYIVGGSISILSGFSTGILRLKDQFTKIVFPSILGNSLILVSLFLYFYYNESKTLSVVIVILAVGTAVTYVIPFLFALYESRTYKSGIGWNRSFEVLRQNKSKILPVAIQTNIASYLKLGSEKGGIFLLGVLSTPTQVALYNVANQLARPLLLLQNNIQPAIYPEIVKLFKKKLHNRLFKIVNNVTIGLTVLGAILMLVSILVAEPLILMFTKEEYLPAIPVFQITIMLVWTTLIGICFYPLTVVLDRMKHRNIIVSLRFLFLGIASFLGLNAINLSIAQLIGSVTTRTLNDFPIYWKLKKNIK